jgi:hypothetical protein
MSVNYGKVVYVTETEQTTLVRLQWITGFGFATLLSYAIYRQSHPERFPKL